MKIISKNKKSFFSYEILEQHICGIVLKGSEVKSLKAGNVSINEAYCYIDSNYEIFIKNMNISIYKEGSQHNNHEPIRDRKLLMKKKSIIKLQENITQKGFTIIPLEVILSNTGFIKIKIGLGRGKNLYDKRQSLKDKDNKRELEKIIR